jgi:hypothetical protein
LQRPTAAAAAVLTVASVFVAPAWVRASPSSASGPNCAPGYRYAGYASRGGVDGVVATISAPRAPVVRAGHAAAWVGVGGTHEGSRSGNEWLQAGVAAFPRTGLRLYVESVSPGRPRRFLDLGSALPGRRYRVQVAEVAANVWQAAIDGRNVGPAAYLPVAHGSWRGIATAETWTNGDGACNSYAYRFDEVAVRASSRWIGLRGAQRVGAPANRIGNAFSAAA